MTLPYDLVICPLYFFNFLRVPAKPTRPRPSSSMVVGSGTDWPGLILNLPAGILEFHPNPISEQVWQSAAEPSPQSGDLSGSLGPVKVGAKGLKLEIKDQIP